MTEDSIQLNFKKINFGKADAVNERDLLIDSFLDTEGHIDKIINGDKFFIIGQKGSGKSAIASKICIISEEEHQIVADLQMLDDFDYNGFDGVYPDNSAPEIRYDVTWEFLLSLKFIEAYSKGEYSLNTKESDPKELVNALKRLGILPGNLKKLIQTFKTKNFKLDAKILSFTSSNRELNNRDIKKIVNSITSHIYNIKPNKKHFVIIDGLDNVLTKRENQYAILSSLIRTANKMNRNFRSAKIESKLVILCRKDVLNKLNDPNRSKYIQDSGIELNWFQNSTDIKDNYLYKLINLRAKTAFKMDVDVMEKFFPPTIYERETFRYLLDNTRYTPRDIIQIMNYIQKVSYDKGATESTIKNGLNVYSDNYFLMEIKDSLVGMLPNDEIEEAFEAISKIGLIEFNYIQFKNELSEGLNPLPILNALYIAGAIGNIEEDEYGQKYRVSKIRNMNSIFNEKKKIAVNPGLKKALMLH